jgi:hypothetical protein
MKITSHFPGGNGVILSLSDSPAASKVTFVAEPRNSAESLYWRLKATGVEGRTVTFHWSQTQNCLGTGHAERLRPVWRDGNGPWSRVPSAEKIPEALGATGLQWSLRFTQNEGEVAFIFPYDPTDLDAALKANPAWQRHIIGVTGGGRPLEALALGPFPAKRGIFVSARSHCNENTGAWALDGFLRAASVAAHPDLCVIAIPAIDPDGAIAGDYGKDKFPHDFNRAWSNAVAMRPETMAIRRLMQRWKDARPLALDLHSPGASEFEGPYFFGGRTVPDHAAVLLKFFDGLYAALPEKLRGPREKFVRLGDYATRWPKDFSFADNTRQELGWPATTIEVPYQGNAPHYFEIIDYQAIGATIWRSMLDVVTK